jgi:hypothetical protein
VLLIFGLSITPVMGSLYNADVTRNNLTDDELISVEFVDYTAEIPVKKTISMLESELQQIRSELRDIIKSDSSETESWNAQIKVLKKHNLISQDTTYEKIKQRFIEKSKNNNIARIFNTPKILPIINNSIFNAICGINFELTNGTTLVFGLNTFINLVGFDIISVHYGHTEEGIETSGLLSRSTSPGQFAGFMFGFLGYWLGTKTGTGIYSDLIVNGFSVITIWLPIPESS